MIWRTQGHREVKRILDRWLSVPENLPQSLLFEGPTGVGKRSLALEFADQISPAEVTLCLDAADSELGVSQMRGHIALWSNKTKTGRLTVVIDNCEQLSPACGNALLKFVESPPAGVTVILVGLGLGLSTLRSRCINLRFSYLSESELLTVAASMGLRPSKEILALAFGRTEWLQVLCENGQVVKQVEELVDLLSNPREVESKWRLLSLVEKVSSFGESYQVLGMLVEMLKAKVSERWALKSLRPAMEALKYYQTVGINKKVLWQKILLPA